MFLDLITRFASLLASLQSAQYLCRSLSGDHLSRRHLVAVIAATVGIPWLYISCTSGGRAIKLVLCDDICKL